MESLEGLPKAFPFLIQLHYNVDNPDTKTLLTQHLEEELEANCKLITRLDIIECAKRKDFIKEDEDVESVEPEKLARGAAVAMYETLAAAMKEKAVRYKEIKDKALADYKASQQPKGDAKTKAPAKASKTDEPLPADLQIHYPADDIDLFIMLKDYPRNEEEALAFAKERYGLNLVVCVREGPPVEVRKEEAEEEEQKVEQKKEQKKESKKEAKKDGKKQEAPRELTEEEKQELAQKLKEDAAASEHFIKALEALAKKSARGSPLRDIFKTTITFLLNPAEPEVSAKEFKDSLMAVLKDLGAKYVGYKNYVSSVKLTPLCKTAIKSKEPEPEVKEEPPEEKEEAKKGTKKDTKKEQKKEAKKVPPEEIKPYDTDAVYPFTQPAFPPSFDDQPATWSLYFYLRNMEHLSREARTVGSILVSLLQQIVVSRGEQVPAKPTEIQELMQLFLEKKEELFKGHIKAVMESEEQPSPTAKIGPAAKSPYNALYREHDYIRLQYHGQKMCDSEVSLQEIELKILNTLMHPGKWGENEVRPEHLRSSMKREMLPFSSLPAYEFERALLLHEFEQMFGRVNLQSVWDFGNRIYEEKLTKEGLNEVLSKAILFSPDVLTSYYPLENALLVGLYYQSPPGRVLRKQWKAPFKHLPDFPNYLCKFATDLPNTLLDVDDSCVGVVEEREKVLYPSDNSVIRVAKRKIAGENVPSIKVFKDNYIFGLKQSLSKEELRGEFWLQFENGTRLNVRMEDQKTGDGALISAAVAALTLSDGLVLQFTATGDVVQSRPENTRSKSEQEAKRVITGKGTVVRYLESGGVEVLMANGNTSEYKDGLWVGINSKGKRRGRKNQEFDMDPISCVSKVDPETLAKVTIRQDNVIMIKYKDGSLYTKHKDETTMLTSADGLSIALQRENFAPMKVRIDPVKVRSNTIISRGGTDALLGADDLMIRSNDGRIVETFLSDGTCVETYKEVQQLPGVDVYTHNFVHLVRREDGGVVKVKSDGEVVVVTPEQRIGLNERGQNRELGKDVDYFYELFAVPTERKSGTYTVQCNTGKLFTLDEEGNKFYVYANGETRERIAVSFDLDDAQNEEPDIPPSPKFEGSTYIDEEAKFLPAPKYTFP